MASRRIEELHKNFQPLIRQLLDESNKVTAPWTTFITDGFRTYADQAKLYAQGRTTAGKIVTNSPAGTSNHEKGLAVDIAFQKDGKLSYEYFDKIVPIARKLGITWGGDWVGFKDRPHFEKISFPAVVVSPMQVGGWYNNPLTGKVQRWWGNNVWTDGNDPSVAPQNALEIVVEEKPVVDTTPVDIPQFPSVQEVETPQEYKDIMTPVNELPTTPDVVPVEVPKSSFIQELLDWLLGFLKRWK